jgi:UDP-glucuronate 4-epimerase
MGRPDMAYFKFTKAILEGKHIDVYNNGQMKRDFTYIDDIVNGVVRVINKIPLKTKSNITNAVAPYKVYNIGNNKPVTLRRFISAIENSCGVVAKEKLLPMQAGDVPITYADVDSLTEETGFKPSTSIESGINNFVNWYKSYAYVK